MKLKATIISLVAVLLVAFVSIGGYCLWPAIDATIKHEKYYTQQDVQDSYDSGYYDGCKNGEELTGQVEYYKILVDEFYNNVNTLNGELATLNAQKKDYEGKIAALTEQNESLESQVTELSQTYAAQIEILNKRINELRASINYYETYISTLENDNQAVATYEIAGTIWKIEIVNKGTELTLAKPANTETEIFNGWKVNGELVGDSYTLNQNTKFVADVTYKYPVKFMVDDSVYNDQLVVENQTAILPQVPVKDGYDFWGWSLNGVDIVDDINTIQVTEDVTYYAVFGLMFNQVDLTGISGYINQNNFWTDGVNCYYSSGKNHYTLNKATNIWELNAWNNQANFGGEYVWTDGNDIYFSTVQGRHGKLNKATNSWEEITWNVEIDGRYVWKWNNEVYYSDYDGDYKLNKLTNRWDEILFSRVDVWAGCTFGGNNIWTDGVNCYFSGYYTQLKINDNRTFTEIEFGGVSNFYGKNVFNFKGKTYLVLSDDCIYELDTVSYTWIPLKITNHNWYRYLRGNLMSTDECIYIVYGESLYIHG